MAEDDRWDSAFGFDSTTFEVREKSNTGARDAGKERETAAILRNLQGVRDRVEARVGKLPVSGRYHRLPRRLEDDYKVQRKALGKGAGGEVRAATHRRHGDRRYAVKLFRLTGIPAKERASLEAEVEVYLSVDHPHIARLVDVYEGESEAYIVMECMEGGELLERLNEVERFAEKDAAEAMFQMLLSINYLHSLGIAHRDIKPENFMYDAIGGERLKLIDFGLSARCCTDVQMDEVCGTLSYAAPEVLAQSYTSQCDLWSLGVISYELLSGSLPFKSTGAFTNQMAAISKGVISFKGKGWKGVSEQAKAFTSNLLFVDPVLRSNAPVALQHHWLSRRAGKSKELEKLDPFVVKGLRKFGRATKFQRDCMAMMAWSISNEESEVFRRNFLRLDKEKNGRISFPDLSEALKNSCQDSGADGNIHDPVSHLGAASVSDFGEMLRIFSAMDANGDWRVQYTDFLAAMMSIYSESPARLSGSVDQLLLKAFDRFDFDRDGDISSQDLQNVLNIGAVEAEHVIAEACGPRQGVLAYATFASHVTGREQALRSSL